MTFEYKILRLFDYNLAIMSNEHNEMSDQLLDVLLPQGSCNSNFNVHKSTKLYN